MNHTAFNSPPAHKHTITQHKCTTRHNRNTTCEIIPVSLLVVGIGTNRSEWASIPTEPTSVFHHKLNAPPDQMPRKKNTHVLHHKLNTPRCTKREYLLTVQGTFACCPQNLTGTQPSLGPTELGHHLCYDRAHLGIRLVLGKVGRIVHHCNQRLKTPSQITELACRFYNQGKQGPDPLHVIHTAASLISSGHALLANIYLRLNGNHYPNF